MAAQHRPGERDPGQPPGRQLLRPERDECSEEGHEDRPVRVQAQPPRLDEVPELVDQDQGDEADRDAPAPDQGVAADGDEDAAELREREAVLGGRPDTDRDRRHEPLRQLAPVRAGMDRLVVAGDLGRLHEITVAGSPASGLRAAPDPLLAALVDLLLPERHDLLEPVDRVLAGGEGVLRGGAPRRR